MDLARDRVDPTQRMAELQTFQRYGVKPPSLQLVTSCLLPGRQGIHRAEFAALVFVCEQFFNTLMFSDSQVALSIAIKCLQRVPLSSRVYHDDLDLVTRLWYAVALGNGEFRKVEAHTDLTALASVNLFNTLGNQCVNDAAIAATTHQWSALQTQ